MTRDRDLPHNVSDEEFERVVRESSTVAEVTVKLRLNRTDAVNACRRLGLRDELANISPREVRD